MHNVPCKLGAPGLALLAHLLLALGCSEQASRPEVVRPVRTLVVAAGDEVQERIFPGRVDASKRAELAFLVPGVLVKLPVKEGQQVAKGEVIGELRMDEFEARLTALKGQLDRARAVLAAAQAGERPEERLRLESQLRSAAARLANSRAEFDRAKRLADGNAIARTDFEAAETAYDVAVEEHKAAQQVLEQSAVAREEDIEAALADVRGLEGRVVEAQLQLADCVLRAPYDGVIARRFVEVGHNVRAMEPIVRFQNVDEAEIAVDVPESVMTADIRRADILQMEAELSGVPGVRFPVRISETAMVADPTTQTFNVRVAMEAPPELQALPGMTAVVRVRFRRAGILGAQILVPASAILQREDQSPAVWVIDAEGRVSGRVVKLGEASGGQVEVVEGLAPGERIAIAGVTFLRDGMQVNDLGDALGGPQ